MNHLAPPDFQGYFWLPGNTDTKIPGRFYCTEDDTLQLDVLGTFSGAPIESDQVEVPRILGVSEKGKLVTLENCFYTKRNFNFPGLAISSIHVNLALVGCHFDKDEPIQFDEVVCHSDAINDWLEFAPIETSLTTSLPRRASVSFSPPAPLVWNISSGVKMKLRSSWTAPIMSQYREARITQKTWVGFEFNQAKSIDELLGIVNRFSKFVSFVVDQTLPLNAIETYSRELIEEIGDVKRQVPIQIFYAPDSRGSPDLSRIAPPFPLFPFRYVRDRFGEIISRWLDNYDRFDSSFNLYFATKTGRDLYLDNRFLMLAQALESLHRHSSSETAFSTEDYSTLCAVFKKVVPDAFKEWLHTRLEYGNEPSLRQRLKFLFKGFESIYGDSKKVKDLISRIVTTRNYLTHYDVSLRQQSARGRELYKLCLSLETLFQLHMATLCGLSVEEVIDLCKRSQLFSRKTAEI